MNKRTTLAIIATLAVVMLTAGAVFALTSDRTPPELTGARRAEQLMQGAGPAPSLPDDPAERACTLAMMDGGWSHADAGNACALGFAVDSPEAMGRCLATTKDKAAEPTNGEVPSYDDRLATEGYYADLCYRLYTGNPGSP